MSSSMSSKLIFNAHLEPILRESVRQYGCSMIFLQDLIEELEKAESAKLEEIEKTKGGLGNPSALSEFLEIVKVSGAKAINKAEESSKVKIDRDPKFAQLKGSIWTAKYFSFAKLALCQRITREMEKTHFDQGYWAKKKGNRFSSWVIRRPRWTSPNVTFGKCF